MKKIEKLRRIVLLSLIFYFLILYPEQACSYLRGPPIFGKIRKIVGKFWKFPLKNCYGGLLHRMQMQLTALILFVFGYIFNGFFLF